MSTTNINLNKLYFEYKVVPKIVGNPPLNALREILQRLKVNNVVMSSTLGEGANEYLGILVSAPAYARVAPVTPFVPPHMPGTLVITPIDTQYYIVMAKLQ